ncbi:MAG: glycerophosphodiester phosphodiesterase [Magnetovibrionaceae bacterium]
MAIVPPVIGHRGAAGQAPENTVVSMVEAARAGVRWVEFDVKLSRDNVPFLLHDDRLERTTSGEGKAADHSFAELERLDAGSWFGAAFAGERIPSLAQICVVLAKHRLGANVEIKPCPGREGETGFGVGAALKRLWPHSLPEPLLSSFSEEALEAAAETAPDLPRALLVDDLPTDWVQRLNRLKAEAIHISLRSAKEETIREVVDAGYSVRVYTVNDAEAAKRLLKAGAEAIFTDRPSHLLPLI